MIVAVSLLPVSLPHHHPGVGTQVGCCLLTSGYDLDIHTASRREHSGKLSWHCMAAFLLNYTTTAAPLAHSHDLLPCHVSKAKAG